MSGSLIFFLNDNFSLFCPESYSEQRYQENKRIYFKINDLIEFNIPKEPKRVISFMDLNSPKKGRKNLDNFNEENRDFNELYQNSDINPIDEEENNNISHKFLQNKWKNINSNLNILNELSDEKFIVTKCEIMLKIPFENLLENIKKNFPMITLNNLNKGETGKKKNILYSLWAHLYFLTDMENNERSWSYTGIKKIYYKSKFDNFS